MLANLKDRRQPRMIELCRRLSFRLKPFQFLLARKLPRQDHLQRYQPVQLRLPSRVNHTHAATSDLTEQFVLAEVLNTFAVGRSGTRQEFRPLRISRIRRDCLIQNDIHGQFSTSGWLFDLPLRNRDGIRHPAQRPSNPGHPAARAVCGNTSRRAESVPPATQLASPPASGWHSPRYSAHRPPAERLRTRRRCGRSLVRYSCSIEIDRLVVFLGIVSVPNTTVRRRLHGKSGDPPDSHVQKNPESGSIRCDLAARMDTGRVYTSGLRSRTEAELLSN